MGIFPELDEDAIFLSRADVNEPLGTFSRHSFTLDGAEWPSVEHYFQALKFEDDDYREKIRQAANPARARRLGRTRLKKIRQDWPKIKMVVMTRGVYIKCRSWPDIAQKLLDSHPRKLIENSQYDYCWGCGRDRRGDNAYGNVLMNVRDKLRHEAAEELQAK